MKFKTKDNFGKEITKTVTWSEHTGACGRCSTVDIGKSATFVNACPTGSQLLMERLIDEQRPAQKEKEKVIREWARKAGVFKDA